MIMQKSRYNNNKCYNNFIHSSDKKYKNTNTNTIPDVSNIIEKEDEKNDFISFIKTVNQEYNKCNQYKKYIKYLPPSNKMYNDPNVFIFTYHKQNIPKLMLDSNESKDKYKKEKPNPKIKVNIECTIHSIVDLIELIHLYPINEEIEYNINIDMLHKIKEPLINLNNMIGMKELKENIVDQILFYIQDLHNFEKNDFMHTIISGPPGTGKTEVAKIIGSIFANLGILKKGTFKKVTRSDLIAGYLGQTAIKTKEVIKEALDGVLFIDEAYSLGSVEKRDSFSKECIDTICEAASDYKSNLMIIVAGYENELDDCFFSYNPGLISRFVWKFNINKYSSEDLYRIFVKKIEQDDWTLDNTINKDWFERKKEYFKYYGRDIETLFSKTKIAHSRRIFGKSNSERKNITITDLEKGFSIFFNNDEVKKRKEKASLKNVLNSMYV